jgi:hypothetical protein
MADPTKIGGYKAWATTHGDRLSEVERLVNARFGSDADAAAIRDIALEAARIVLLDPTQATAFADAWQSARDAEARANAGFTGAIIGVRMNGLSAAATSRLLGTSRVTVEKALQQAVPLTRPDSPRDARIAELRTLVAARNKADAAWADAAVQAGLTVLDQPERASQIAAEWHTAVANVTSISARLTGAIIALVVCGEFGASIAKSLNVTRITVRRAIRAPSDGPAQASPSGRIRRGRRAAVTTWEEVAHALAARVQSRVHSSAGTASPLSPDDLGQRVDAADPAERADQDALMLYERKVASHRDRELARFERTRLPE